MRFAVRLLCFRGRVLSGRVNRPALVGDRGSEMEILHRGAPADFTLRR
jgi:hypothetical protein